MGGVEFNPADGVWPIHRSTTHCGTLAYTQVHYTLWYSADTYTLMLPILYGWYTLVQSGEHYKVSTYDNKVKLNTCTYIYTGFQAETLLYMIHNTLSYTQVTSC